MEYYLLKNIIYSDICLIFIVTGVICGIVRWFHMCRPYDIEEKYFYPARKLVSMFYIGIILELPYVFMPSDTGVWDYIRMFGILYYPLCFSALFLKYFCRLSLENRGNKLFFSLTMAILLVMLMVLAIGKGYWFEEYRPWLMSICCVLSIVMSVRLMIVTNWIRRKIIEYHHENFSDERDFPYRFAERVLWLPSIWIVLVWVIFVLGSRDVKVVMDIVFSVVMVAFLCMILHPQKILQSPEVKTAMDDMEKIETEHMEEELELSFEPNKDQTLYVYDEDAKRQVLDIILRRYKEQHLQKKDVLAEVDKGKIAPASRFIASVGYYNLINMFRLEYARLYMEANPMAKQAVVAEASGFASGPSFSKAKKSVPEIDRDLVSGVHL